MVDVCFVVDERPHNFFFIAVMNRHPKRWDASTVQDVHVCFDMECEQQVHAGENICGFALALRKQTGNGKKPFFVVMRVHALWPPLEHQPQRVRLR